MFNSQIEDDTLASLCTNNKDKARELLYKKYAAKVYMLCMRYLGNEDLAKDLMHDCFIRIFNNLHKYNPSKSSLKTWISHITVNYLIDYLRRRRKLSFTQIDEQTINMTEPEHGVLAQIPQKEILRMISELPNTRRIIFNLYCIENYSHQEIAAMLGIKEKTSSSILFKARLQLIDKINTYIQTNGL